MPIFDFKCVKCNNEKEMLIKSSDAEHDVWCSKCDLPMEKQISSPGGFKFNGGGYYETDFKNKK